MRKSVRILLYIVVIGITGFVLTQTFLFKISFYNTADGNTYNLGYSFTLPDKEKLFHRLERKDEMEEGTGVVLITKWTNGYMSQFTYTKTTEQGSLGEVFELYRQHYLLVEDMEYETFDMKLFGSIDSEFVTYNRVDVKAIYCETSSFEITEGMYTVPVYNEYGELLNTISLMRYGIVSGREDDKWIGKTMTQDVIYSVYKVTTEGYKTFIYMPTSFIGGLSMDETIEKEKYTTYTFNGNELEIITENFQIE